MEKKIFYESMDLNRFKKLHFFVRLFEHFIEIGMAF